MGKSKMIAKSCPKCDLQVAVASKSCKCGHVFFMTRRSQDVGRSSSPGDDIRRRTARVKRGKPQYYDSQEFQKQNKKKSPKKRSTDVDYKTKDTVSARRRRALRRAQKVNSNTGGNTSVGSTHTSLKQLKPGQLARCNIILQEINRKMLSVTCRPAPL